MKERKKGLFFYETPCIYMHEHTDKGVNIKLSRPRSKAPEHAD